MKDIKPNGDLVDRWDPKGGKHANLCPAIAGGFSWNAGSYSPKTGLLYKVGFEWCQDLEITKTEPITEPVVQLNIGADFTMHVPGTCAREDATAKDTKAWATSVHAIPSPALSSMKSSTPKAFLTAAC